MATAATATGALDDGVVITLTLMTDAEDVSLPLMVGEITARVTLIDTETGIDTFDDAFTSPMVIFAIQPAQCTLLFPGRDRHGPVADGDLHNQSGIWGRYRRWEPGIHLLQAGLRRDELRTCHIYNWSVKPRGAD